MTAGYLTGYTHDVLGNLVKIAQGAQSRYFAYDSLSHLLRVRNPEQAAKSELALPANQVSLLSDNNNSWSLKFEYDEGGNVKARTDARGVKTSYQYDGLGRVIKRTYSLTGGAPPNYVAAPDAEYFYDGKG